MKYPESIQKSIPALIFIFAFCCLGLYLFTYALPSKTFNEELLITDCIWLDAWALGFFIAVILIWISRLSWRWKAGILVGLFSIYGVVMVSLTFNGTPFGFNAYWGDQKFRTAMILKFITFAGWPDFYYKDLPAFYPPLYYYLLSLYARLFSVEAFKMIKVGTLLIYLIGPGLLYCLWRRLVTPFAAALVTICTFLFCSAEMLAMYAFPHAFLANIFFVPWWLYYVGQVRPPSQYRWTYYLAGGVIGGLIFMTYYYVFFVGGLLWLVRTVVRGRWRLNVGRNWHPGRALGVLLAAALFSAPFWLPLVWSMVSIGADPAQQEWHHADSTGILFRFQDFSIIGVVYLAALYYALRHHYNPKYRELLLLVGAAFLFCFIGIVLGAMQKPIIVIKAREFVSMLAGPFVGLMLAGLLRRSGIIKKARLAVPVLASFLLLFLLNSSNGIAKHGATRTARKATVPTFHADPAEMNRLAGAVFLTGVEELQAFYPVYNFFSINQHYSHPAGQFMNRYRFLYTLKEIDDPYLVHLALRHNVYDPVDVIMPRRQGDNFEFYAAVSNYPDRFVSKTLSFPVSLFSDTTRFVPLSGDNMYRVVDISPAPNSTHDGAHRYATDDIYAGWVDYVAQSLDAAGQSMLASYVGQDRIGRRELLKSDDGHTFGNELTLLSCNAIKKADSLLLVFVVYAERNISRDYRTFLHLFPDDGGTMQNYDFSPEPQTRTWKNGDINLLARSIPIGGGDFSLSIGFFHGQYVPGNTFVVNFTGDISDGT